MQVVKEGLAGSVQLLPPPPGQQHAHPQLLLRASIALPLAQAAQAAHPAGGGDVYVDASQRAPVPSAEVWAAAAALGLLPESVQALAGARRRAHAQEQAQPCNGGGGGHLHTRSRTQTFDDGDALG